MCANDVDADACFTRAQLQTIEDFYRGPYDSRGTSIIKGRAFGAERGWTEYIPHAGNQMFPTHLFNARDHAAFLFYENDPGVPVPRANDLTYVPDKTATPPEWAWWEFDIDDLTAGKSDLMKSLMNATDPDLQRFLVRGDRKLILWHGWNDAGAPPEPTKDYYDQVVATTFGGDRAQAREDARLFMFPGMGHCGGGPGQTRGIRSRLSSSGSRTARRRICRRAALDRRPRRQRAARLRLSTSRALLGPRRRRKTIPPTGSKRNFSCR